MPRYAVILNTSWDCNSYDEIVVEAETAAKAKYKAAKCFGGPAEWAAKSSGIL